MSNDAMAKMTDQYQNFLGPLIKANKLSAATKTLADWMNRFKAEFDKRVQESLPMSKK
ncbi:MAG: hypothetical protein ACOYMW_10620 [Candidatus Competibacteraceae bacterium]